MELYFKVHGETDEDAALIAEHDGIWDAYDGPTITREQFLAEVQESADEYQRTGLNLTHEEVDAWLGRLQRGKDAQLPECHT